MYQEFIVNKLRAQLCQVLGNTIRLRIFHE